MKDNFKIISGTTGDVEERLNELRLENTVIILGMTSVTDCCTVIAEVFPLDFKIDLENEELKNQRDNLMLFVKEFTEAIENEEIIIQENLDNDGFENWGGRMYDKAKKLIEQ